MCRLMIIVIHRNNYSKKSADFGQIFSPLAFS
jgi:hypothetical protein